MSIELDNWTPAYMTMITLKIEFLHPVLKSLVDLHVCHDGDAITYNSYKLGLFVGNIEVIGYLLEYNHIFPLCRF